MRLGVWLCASVGQLCWACSGGYPLEPTACDDWCDVTRGNATGCGDYNPAGCVSECEQMQLDVAQCRPQFDATLTCFRTTPDAIAAQCDYYSYVDYMSRPCYAESQALLTCSGAYLQDFYRED